MEFSSGLPFPSPGVIPTQGSNFGLLHCWQILYHLTHLGSQREIWESTAKHKNGHSRHQKSQVITTSWEEASENKAKGQKTNSSIVNNCLPVQRKEKMIRSHLHGKQVVLLGWRREVEWVRGVEGCKLIGWQQLWRRRLNLRNHNLITIDIWGDRVWRTMKEYFFGVGISKGWGQGSLACCSPWVAKLETNWQVINNRQWGTIHLIHMVLH